MAEGRPNRAIAAGLFVGDGAVEEHVKDIFLELELAPTDTDHCRGRPS
jgi:DNA-binding NarL/FixJ family response regulator